MQVNKLTVDDILEMPTGMYLIEILPLGSNTKYNIYRGDSNDIKTKENVIAIELDDVPPILEMPIYISEPQSSILKNYKYIEPQFDRTTKLGIELCIIPAGTKFYKGMDKMSLDKNAIEEEARRITEQKRDNYRWSVYRHKHQRQIKNGGLDTREEAWENGVSFYTLNPVYALQYTARKTIGGLFAFKSTKDIHAFLYTHENIKKIYDIIKKYDVNVNDSNASVAKEYILNALMAQCASEYDDVIEAILHMSKFYLIDNPWKLYKKDLAHNKSLKAPCANKTYNAKIDRAVNPLLLELGKLLGFECTFQETEFVPFATGSVFHNEFVFYAKNSLVRDTTDILDVHNWVIPQDLRNTSIESRSIKSLTDVNHIYRFYIDNKEHGRLNAPKKPHTEKNKVLRVGSFNVHGMRSLDTKISIDSFAQKIRELLAATNADVLFLEEYPTVYKEIHTHGWDFMKDNNAAGRLTIACFVKHELLDTWKWNEFQAYEKIDSTCKVVRDEYNLKSRKGYLQVNLVNGLVVVGIHLTIYVGDSRIYRQHELNTVKKETAADIIIGDYNETSENITRDKLYTLVEFEGNTTSFNRVDHALVKNDIKVLSNFIVKTNISDHLPIFVDIAARD